MRDGQDQLQLIAGNGIVRISRHLTAGVRKEGPGSSRSPTEGRSSLRRQLPPEPVESSRVRVHRALARLPEHHRTVIELVYWSGLPQSEIATLLGIPAAKVTTHTRAALACLADVVAQDAVERS